LPATDPERQVKQPVQDGVLADIAARNLIGEQAKDRCLPFVAAEHQLRGQCVILYGRATA
jgi:hypothetical protein